MPEKDIISGYKGVIDFYVYRHCANPEVGMPGVPCARMWPRSPGHKRSPNVEAQWASFSIASRLWLSLSDEVQTSYREMAQSSSLSGRDIFTKGYLSGIYRYDKGVNMLPCSVAYPSVTQDNIPNATPVKVILDLEEYDIGGNFDTVNSRFIAPRDGRYLISGNILWSSPNANKRYDVHIYKNGAWIRGAVYDIPLVGFMTTATTCILNLLAGDFIELWAYHACGAATPDIQTWGSQGWTRLEVALIE